MCSGPIVWEFESIALIDSVVAGNGTKHSEANRGCRMGRYREAAGLATISAYQAPTSSQPFPRRKGQANFEIFLAAKKSNARSQKPRPTWQSPRLSIGGCFAFPWVSTTLGLTGVLRSLCRLPAVANCILFEHSSEDNRSALGDHDYNIFWKGALQGNASGDNWKNQEEKKRVPIVR